MCPDKAIEALGMSGFLVVGVILLIVFAAGWSILRPRDYRLSKRERIKRERRRHAQFYEGPNHKVDMIELPIAVVLLYCGWTMWGAGGWPIAIIVFLAAFVTAKEALFGRERLPGRSGFSRKHGVTRFDARTPHCPACNGWGRIDARNLLRRFWHGHSFDECPECGGNGKHIGHDPFEKLGMTYEEVVKESEERCLNQ